MEREEVTKMAYTETQVTRGEESREKVSKTQNTTKLLRRGKRDAFSKGELSEHNWSQEHA